MNLLNYELATISLRLDGIIHLKWCIIFIPIFVMYAIDIYITVMSIPSILRKFKDAKQSDDEDPLSSGVWLDAMNSINTILIILAQIFYLLRLDGFINWHYSIALIPLYLYSLKFVYEPFYYYKKQFIELMDFLDTLRTLRFVLTALLMALKVDGIWNIAWAWTFTPLWLDILLSVIYFMLTIHKFPSRDRCVLL